GQEEFQAVDIPEKIAQLPFVDGKLPNCEQVQTEVGNYKQNACYRQSIPVFAERDRTEAASDHCSHEERSEPRAGFACKDRRTINEQAARPCTSQCNHDSLQPRCAVTVPTSTKTVSRCSSRRVSTSRAA